MGFRAGPGSSYFSHRLRSAVLGGAACSVRYLRGDAGDNSGFHGFIRNYFFANPETHFSFGDSAADRDSGGGSVDEPFADAWRGTNRQVGRAGADRCSDQLVGGISAKPQTAASAIQNDEFGDTNACRRNNAGPGVGDVGRIS